MTRATDIYDIRSHSRTDSKYTSTQSQTSSDFLTTQRVRGTAYDIVGDQVDREEATGSSRPCAPEKQVFRSSERSSDSAVAPLPVVLDHYSGRIVSIEGEKVFVSLWGEDGAEFKGWKSSSEFGEIPVEVGQPFSCRTVIDASGRPRVEISLSPRTPIGEELKARIREELEDLFQ